MALPFESRTTTGTDTRLTRVWNNAGASLVVISGAFGSIGGAVCAGVGTGAVCPPDAGGCVWEKAPPAASHTIQTAVRTEDRCSGITISGKTYHTGISCATSRLGVS